MSDKVRVHEIAKELGINSKEVVEKAAEMGLDVKTASSSVSMNDAEQIMNYIMNGAPAPTPEQPKVTVKKAAKTEENAPAEATPAEEEAKPAARSTQRLRSGRPGGDEARHTGRLTQKLPSLSLRARPR